MASFAEMSAAQIQAGLEAGEYSAVDIAKDALARVRAVDGRVHAFLEVTEDLALAQARRCFARRSDPWILPPD